MIAVTGTSLGLGTFFPPFAVSFIIDHKQKLETSVITPELTTN